MGAGAAPQQQNWKWFQDDAAEPSTPLANENTAPTLGNNTSILRLRVSVSDVDGQTSAAWSAEYSTDDSSFTAMGSGNAWNYANGQGANGSATTTFKTSDGTEHGNYHEDGSGSEGITSGKSKEVDFALLPTATVAPNTLYYFRVKIGGVAVTLASGKSHPQLTTAANTGGLIYARFCQTVAVEPFAGSVIRTKLFAGAIPKADARIIRRICKLVEYGPYAGHIVRQRPRGTNTVVSPGLGMPRRAKHAVEPDYQRLMGWHPRYVWRLRPISVDFNPTKILEMILAATGPEQITMANQDELTITLESNNTITLSLTYGQAPTLTLRYQNQIELTITD